MIELIYIITDLSSRIDIIMLSRTSKLTHFKLRAAGNSLDIRRGHGEVRLRWVWLRLHVRFLHHLFNFFNDLKAQVTLQSLLEPGRFLRCSSSVCPPAHLLGREEWLLHQAGADDGMHVQLLPQLLVLQWLRPHVLLPLDRRRAGN